ncbi:MAG: VWA domain-containing protein, partial [Verrucomicrobiota bacterium]
MSFSYPWLWLLCPVALWLVLRRREGQGGVRVASLSQWDSLSKGKARYLWVLKLLSAIFVTALIAAMARPQMGSSQSVDEAEGIAIELLVDVSSSMDRTVALPDGEKQTRLEVAKEMLERFILGDEGELTGRPDDLIGLITFARYADTRSPLTFGHNALVQIVRNLQIQDRPNEDGTAYGDALTLACARLKGLEELRSARSSRKLAEIESRIVVLLTDGENNSGKHLPLESAGLAKKWGIRVYCITLGDPEDFYGEDRA